MEKEKGFVYILTNKSFRDDWVKIGKSSRPVDVRSKELDNTAVPLPFDIFATMQTVKYAEIEKIIHKQIDRLTDLRIRQNREFFNVEPNLALEILFDLATALDDSVIMKYVDGKPYQIYPHNEMPIPKKCVKKSPRKPFAFSMIGLKAGDIVTFEPLKLDVKVADDKKVEYEGRLWSLSAFTGTYIPEEMSNKTNTYQGPKYFTYNGKPLSELRNEMENECDEESDNKDIAE